MATGTTTQVTPRDISSTWSMLECAFNLQKTNNKGINEQDLAEFYVAKSAAIVCNNRRSKVKRQLKLRGCSGFPKPVIPKTRDGQPIFQEGATMGQLEAWYPNAIAEAEATYYNNWVKYTSRKPKSGVNLCGTGPAWRWPNALTLQKQNALNDKRLAVENKRRAALDTADPVVAVTADIQPIQGEDLDRVGVQATGTIHFLPDGQTGTRRTTSGMTYARAVPRAYIRGPPDAGDSDCNLRALIGPVPSH